MSIKISDFIILFFVPWPTSKVLVRLQTPMGAIRVRRGEHASRSIRSHLEAGYQSLQQVSRLFHLFRFFSFFLSQKSEEYN